MKIQGFKSNNVPFVYPKACNNEFKWWPSDTEENYDSTNNFYGPDDITYKFNEYGFRCDSFDLTAEKRILFLGCSFTMGTGLPLEHTWAFNLLTHINQYMDRKIPYWNIAFGASGLDAQVRLYYNVGMKLKPHLVFAYLPSYRRELYHNDDVVLSPHLPSHPTFNFKGMKYLADSRIIQYETEKNLSFLDLMLKSTNTKMIHGTWDSPHKSLYEEIQTFHNFSLILDQKARDKVHAGRFANARFAKEIFENHKDIIINALKD